MSENKRFYLDETGINDKEYEFGLIGEDELVDVINELNDENERNKKVERMKLTIRLIIVLIALVLILWGIFFPLTKEYVIQQVLGIACFCIALGIGIGRM